MTLFSSTVLQRFLTIAEQGSLHSAAAKLAITQPALTRTLRNLEDQIGEPLFLRHAKGLTPTDLGEKVIGMAQNIMRECEIAESQINPRSASYSAHVRIGAGPVWASSILPKVISDLTDRFPKISFELELATRATGRRAIADGRLDILAGGFAGVEHEKSMFAFQHFFDIELCIVARKDHPIRLDGVSAIEELGEYPWISYQFDRYYLDEVISTRLASDQKRPVVRLFTSSLLTTVRTIATGKYLAVLPRRLAEDFSHLELAVVPLDGNPIHVPSGLVFRTAFRNTDFFNEMSRLIRIESSTMPGIIQALADPTPRQHDLS